MLATFLPGKTRDDVKLISGKRYTRWHRVVVSLTKQKTWGGEITHPGENTRTYPNYYYFTQH